MEYEIGNYNAIFLNKAGGSLKFTEKTFRPLEPQEILVKMRCTSIHPADLLFLKGEYGDFIPTYPLIPGLEGSGEIVKVGTEIDKVFLGKRIGCLSSIPKEGKLFHGTWAEYYYSNLSSVMIFENNVPFEKICFLINPLSAVGIIDTVKKQNANSFIQNAAASSLGKMLIKLAKVENIEVLNILRDNKHVNELKKIGANNIVTCSTNDWELDVIKISQELNVKVAFDCVGGEYTSTLFNLLTRDSTLYNYGNMEGKDMNNIKSSDLIFKGKTLKGWWLVKWLVSLSEEELKIHWNFVRDHLQSQSDIFYTELSEKYGLCDIEKAICKYEKNHEKILILPFKLDVNIKPIN